MRYIRGTGLSSPGFEDNIKTLTRNSPWWLTSGAVHALAALILWHIPFRIDEHTVPATIVADAAEELKPVEDEPDPPDVKPPDESVTEVPHIDEADEPKQEEIDEPFDEVVGEEGDTTGPITGPSYESVIGLGNGPGGGRGRGGGKRSRGAKGSTARTEDAVDLGLKWLADHQDVEGDGRWDCDDFMKHDPAHDKCTGPGGAMYDVGVTGLALLAFLGANYTDRYGPYARNVRYGLRYLMRSQDEDGCFGSRASKHFMYNHAIATLAMCEAYWMTRNPRYKKPAQEALTFITRSRNPYLAWRYEPRGGENDTSVTGWMVMALKAGMWAGLEIDPDAFEGARQWIDKMTDAEFGQVGYDQPGGGVARPEGLQERFPAEKSQAMTAVGMLSRLFLGEDPRASEMIRKGAARCAELPPKWDEQDGSIDMYYWYYGTLAMFQVGGTPWKTWNRAMKQAIVGKQFPRGSGTRTGSWDPIGVWGSDGGRVYSTATMVLCLEVYYRYDKVIGSRMRDR